ncbi:hypothetical protein CKA32_004443 [Geitlerinema sp. FC II]|nr:hypothetical protein CKA32_004443 [Geitlerinema sp. FC II]
MNILRSEGRSSSIALGASQFCKNISFGWQNSRLALPV